MKRDHKYWPYLILLVICVVFSAGYLALAQEQASGIQTEQSGDAQSSEGVEGQLPGEPGIAIKASVLNFAKQAGRESLISLPAPNRKPKVIHKPGPPPFPRSKSGDNVFVPTEEPQSFIGEPNAPLVASPLPAATFKARDDNQTSLPPDTNGAVGPNHLLVALNTEIVVQSRTGVVIQSMSLDSFWAGLPGPWKHVEGPSTFDPKVLYDPYNNRWILTVCADGGQSTSAILVAVSKTSDPTGLWNRYKVDFDSAGTSWADYPSLGFNKNWIVVSVNKFPIAEGPSGGAQVFAFNKANLYAGAAGAFKKFVDANGFTMAPAVTFDNTLNTLYLIEEWDGSLAKLRISSLTGTPAAPVMSTSHPFVTSPSPWSDFPPNGEDFAPQKGSVNKIQLNDARIQNVIYRNGSLWTAHTIFLPAGVSPTRSAVQWWQLTPTGTIQQRGRLEDTTGAKFYGFPSITVNAKADVLIGCSRFSTAEFPSAVYAFRAATDAANTLRTPTLLKAGAAPYYKSYGDPNNRWGDYSHTVVDPVNDLDMWTIQEYATTRFPTTTGCATDMICDRWSTWWGRVGPSTPAPLIQLGTVTATDTNPSDPDTTIEPGEGGKLTIQLKNVGSAAATGISAKLTTSTAGVTITGTGMSAYPNLAAKTGVGNNTTPFTFNVASTVPCSTLLSFTLTVTYTGGNPLALSFKVPTGNADAPVTIAYAGAAKAIPDNNATGINIPLAVSGLTGKISDLNFKIGGATCTTTAGATSVGIDHTWVGDLVITLKSPQGTVVTLVNQAGGVLNEGHNFCNTTLDDESAGGTIQNVTASQAPYSGSFKPANPLSTFDGQTPNGTWTLNVADRGVADTGNVRAFSLTITTQSCSATALATPVEIESDRALSANLSAGHDAASSESDINPALQTANCTRPMFYLDSLIPCQSDSPSSQSYLNEPYIAEGFFSLRIEDEPVRTPFVWKRNNYWVAAVAANDMAAPLRSR
jgi:subtilisin-like proprotein convertase family protein